MSVTMQILKTLILSGVLALAGCDNRPNFPTSSTFNIAEHSGVWQSQGYGYLMKIDANGMQLFDTTRVGCVQKAMSSADIASHMAVFHTITDEHIWVSETPNSTRYYFNRLPNKDAKSVIDKCLTSPNHNPTDNFIYFTQTMSEHYAFFETYQQDWPKIVEQYESKVNDDMSQTELFNLFSNMIKKLDDAHVFLSARINDTSKRFQPNESRILRPALSRAFKEQNEIKDERTFRLHWYEQYKHQVRTAILNESANDIGKFIIWGMTDNIGYINLQRMQNFSQSGSIQDDVLAIQQAMDTIMATLATSDAIIFDITANGGGHDEVGLAIAQYFNAKQRLAYSKTALGGPTVPQKFYVNKANEPPYIKPVYLVTSDHTVSAAETFTMAMRAIPNVIHVGDTTRGNYSDVLDKTLLNGWHLGLSNETYQESDGKISEGIGLKPAQSYPIFSNDNIFESHSIAINTLVRDVKAKL